MLVSGELFGSRRLTESATSSLGFSRVSNLGVAVKHRQIHNNKVFRSGREGFNVFLLLIF